MTEAKTMEKVRAIDEKRNKKKATKRNVDYAVNANIPSKQQKVLQCRKCKANLHDSMQYVKTVCVDCGFAIRYVPQNDINKALSYSALKSVDLAVPILSNR